MNLKLSRFSIVIRQTRGSGWVPVGFTDFKSAGVHPSMCAEGSTPLHSRHPKFGVGSKNRNQCSVALVFGEMRSERCDTQL